MNKHPIIIAIAVLLIYVGLNGCVVRPVIEGTGTIEYIDIEGGFYGIICDEGPEEQKNLYPINLPQEFKVDDLRIKFFARIMLNQLSFHMWGINVKIIKIEKLDSN